MQSLANMIVLLNEEYDFFVITSAYDLGASTPYPTIKTNQWNLITIGNHKTQVWYANQEIDYTIYNKVIKNVKADFVFFNCMYSYRFFLYPLLHKKWIFLNYTKFIISPRGILQSGSLAVKSVKKKIYLQLLKKTKLSRNCTWIASGKEERVAIKKHFGNEVFITIISNIPKIPFANIAEVTKQQSVLRLVHLSLISPVKNIKDLILILTQCTQTIFLDIYGPVKDEDYWQACIKEIVQMPSNVFVMYHGDLLPDKVQETLQQYDALILLTRGENFGHVLFESLSVGRPIITSYFTPWNNLEEKSAGWNVDLNHKKSIANLLDNLATKSTEEWQLYCKGAHDLAVNYFEEQNFKESYRKLFS